MRPISLHERLPAARKHWNSGLLTSPTVDRTSFREAMSHLAAAVHIVTTDGPAGRRGVTATSVCSVSDAPATLLVCLNTSNPLNERFEKNGVFAVNLLHSEAEPLARVFAGHGGLSGEERFASAEWSRLATGAPALDGALANFDCRLLDARLVGTHKVMIGEVVGLRIGAPAPALVYRNRHYHRV